MDGAAEDRREDCTANTPRAHRDMPDGSNGGGNGTGGNGNAVSIGVEPRHDWSLAQAEALFALPFTDLIYGAQRVHRAWHQPNTVQMSTLLSIKTGGCPEDCAYCPQSVRYQTGVDADALMPLSEVLERARAARAAGATRFCMGAAYRSPKRKELEKIAEMVRAVRALGPASCAALGMRS